MPMPMPLPALLLTKEEYGGSREVVFSWCR